MKQPEIVLDKWQEDLLNHEGHLLLCTGRQVGKTTTFAHKAAKYMMEHEHARIIVVSLTEDQAQLMIVMVLSFLEKHCLSQIEDKKKAPTKSTIWLKNGSNIIARPVGNTGDAVRGFTGDVLIVDEASKMPEQMWASAKPTLLTTGGQIWMCSTPFGKQGYFYECFLNKHKRYKVFHISSEEVIKSRPITPAWTKERSEGAIRRLEEEKEDMGVLAYSQEYLGLFMEDLRRFFSDDLIYKACILSRGAKNREFDHFLGLDIARLGEDSGTFEIIEKRDARTFMQVENEVTKKKLTTETFQRICELENSWNFKQIGIDAGAGSLGVGILDFLKRENFGKKVIALNNRTITLDKYGEHSRGLLKEDMYEMMRLLMERGYLKLLKDPDLIASLKSVQIEYVIKEGQPTKVKIFGRDTHIAEGLIRAVWLANQKSLNVSISYM